MAKLNEYQFNFSTGSNSEWDEEGKNLYHLTATHKGNEIGYLGWQPYGMIGHVVVNPDHRGKGVADALLEKATTLSMQSQGSVPRPVHSNDLTPAGYRFAKRNWWAGQVHPDYGSGWEDEPLKLGYDIKPND
jgi:GNAT superfamily N-acetyltransferase